MTTNITNSKICSYGCNTQIYWNTTKKAYYEVETGNKHYCVSRSTKTQATNNNTQANRPTYYSGSGKPWNQQTKQQQHSNSIQVLKGSDVQKQYERLSDILVEVGGKIHGSQAHYVDKELLIVVYYEVPTAENREQVKQKFKQLQN